MSLPEVAAPVLLLAGGAGYAGAVWRLRRRGDGWPLGRVLAAVAGLGCLLVAVVPPVSEHDEVFEVHVLQHLLLGMLGPTLLAVSAPMTLALRVLPAGPRRGLLAVLRARPVRLLAGPPVALVLQVGGGYLLYLTPLYAATLRYPLLHDLVHAHMVAAGCLFAWSIAGLDPIAHRPGTRTRLVALTAAAAGHNVLAKLLYAHALPGAAGPVADRLAGAQLLYYGGDVADALLAVVVMAQWYARAGRRQRHAYRRATAPGSGGRPAAVRPGVRGPSR